MADLQNSSSPGVKEGIKRTLSRKNVQLSTRLVSQEKHLEKETNSAANLKHLLGIAGMRQGYLAAFHVSLLRSRYGDYEAHRAFITKASPPANSRGAALPNQEPHVAKACIIALPEVKLVWRSEEEVLRLVLDTES